MITMKDVLRSNSFWVLNKDLVIRFDPITVTILSVLAEAENMLADDDGWFFQTHQTIEKLTGIKRSVQDRCINTLKEANILIQENRGLPQKRYFKLVAENIGNLGTFSNTNNVENQHIENDDIQSSKLSEIDNYKEHNNKKPKNKKSTQKEFIKFGGFKNILLTSEEYKKLIDKYSESVVIDIIDKMSTWCESKGKQYKSYYKAIIKWLDNRNVSINTNSPKRENKQETNMGLF